MGKLVGDKYGIHRVIEPQGVLTQAALKIDNDMTKKYSNEIICDVISLKYRLCFLHTDRRGMWW